MVISLGKSGQVATALMERSEARGIPAFCIGRPEVDIATLEDLPEVFDAMMANIKMWMRFMTRCPTY